MRRLTLATGYIICMVLAAGCGGSKTGSEPSTAAATSTPPAGAPAAGAPAGSVATTIPAVSPYDSGPRASESPVDKEKVVAGEKLFQSKGCVVCHAFGKKVTGPDLAGVSQRRTQLWLEHQILHPEVMTKEDPIARDLLAKHSLQMPNQKLTEEEARAVIEYFKQKDREAVAKGN